MLVLAASWMMAGWDSTREMDGVDEMSAAILVRTETQARVDEWVKKTGTLSQDLLINLSLDALNAIVGGAGVNSVRDEYLACIEGARYSKMAA